MKNKWTDQQTKINEGLCSIGLEFVKTFEDMPLRMMWKYAQESLSEAAEIYIMGYSFPKADILARQLLLHVNESLKKIIVIDPLTDTCHETDKCEDIIPMLPWNIDLHFWAKKIEIIKQRFDDYAKDSKQVLKREMPSK